MHPHLMHDHGRSRLFQVIPDPTSSGAGRSTARDLSAVRVYPATLGDFRTGRVGAWRSRLLGRSGQRRVCERQLPVRGSCRPRSIERRLHRYTHGNSRPGEVMNPCPSMRPSLAHQGLHQMVKHHGPNHAQPPGQAQQGHAPGWRLPTPCDPRRIGGHQGHEMRQKERI